MQGALGRWAVDQLGLAEVDVISWDLVHRRPCCIVRSTPDPRPGSRSTQLDLEP